MKKVSRTSTVLLLVGVTAIAAVLVAGATAKSSKKSAGIQACGLMPDTKTSIRWEQFDKPYLQKAFKAAGVSGPRRQRPGRPAEAEDAGRPVHRRRREGPDHRPDRLRLGGRDREGRRCEGRQVDRLRPPGRGRQRPCCTRRSTVITVGVLQGTAVVDGLKSKKGAVVAELNGGQEDANSFLFKGGVRLGPQAAVRERRPEEGPGSVRARAGTTRRPARSSSRC